MRASRALAILLAIAIPATAVAQRRERGGTTTSSSSTTVGTSSPRSTVEGFQEPTAERTVSTEPELETVTEALNILVRRARDLDSAPEA